MGQLCLLMLVLQSTDGYQKQVNRLAISPDKTYVAAAGNSSVR